MALAALLFLMALGGALARPVLRALDSDPPIGQRAPIPRPDVSISSPEAILSPSPDSDAKARKTNSTAIRLAGTYPARCLRKAHMPDGPGLIASIDRPGRIAIGTTSSITGRIQGRPPLMWSPSGRYLAFGNSRVYDIERNKIGRLLSRRLERWTWSPAADCVAGVVGDALVVGRPGGDASALLRGVTSFTFSPNGRFILASDARANQAMINVVSGRLVPKPSRLMEEVLRRPCIPAPKAFVDVSCSENERFAVAIHNPDGGEGNLGRLSLLDSRGRFVRFLTTGPYEDTAPEWGPARTGVLFLKHPPGTGRLEVWFLPEGGIPTSTPFALVDIRVITHETFMPWQLVDWSATPSRGFPVPFP